MQIQTFADQLYFTTVRLTATDGSKSWAGTSFVYAVPTDRGHAHFLLTNKHVVEEARRRGPLGLALRMLAKRTMRREAARHLEELKIGVQ